jgi:hypothetical protein
MPPVGYIDPSDPNNWANPQTSDQLIAQQQQGGGNQGGSTGGTLLNALGTFGGANLVGLGIGVFQSILGAKGLNDLKKQPDPNYSVSPELQKAYSQSEQDSHIGMTGAEKAAYQQNLNQGAASNLYSGVGMAGGNLGNALQAGINSQELGSYAKMAAYDADIHRKNIMQYQEMAGAMQQQKNLIDQQKIIRRHQIESAYANTLTSGLQNIGKSANLGGVFGNELNTGVPQTMGG